MKELITTQLIAEYQKEVDFYEKHIKAKTLSESTLALYGYKKSLLNEVIRSLQSKQSKERQNIVDAVTDTIENTSYQKDGDGYIHCEFDGEDYFNQTFKQEQKVIDANGGEKEK